MKCRQYRTRRWTTQQDVGSFLISTTGGGIARDQNSLIRRRVTGNGDAESARATRESRRTRDRPVKLGRIVVRLAADGGAALGADVVVFAAGREHQKELLPRRRRAPTAGTEEARRLELLEAVAGPRHRANSRVTA